MKRPDAPSSATSIGAIHDATGRRGDIEALVTLYGCKGNAAASIPVLEKSLPEAKITPRDCGEFKP